MARRKVGITLVPLVLAGYLSFGQQHNYKKYSVEQGIQAQISCLLQDSRGYIWIGTENGGLNRFDGKTFTNFSKNQGIASLKITSICEDDKGNIWIGTPAGLNCYNGRTFKHYDQKSGLGDTEIKIIQKDKKGNLWITTGHGLSVYNGKAFKTLYQKDGLSDTKVNHVFIDSKDNIWISFRDDKHLRNVDKFDGKKFTRYFFNDLDTTETLVLSSFAEDPKGRIWVTSFNWGAPSVFVLLNESFQAFPLYEKLRENKVHFRKKVPMASIFFDSKNQVWFNTMEQIFCGELNPKADGSHPADLVLNKSLVKMKGLTPYTVVCALEDSNKNIWLGTPHGLTVYAGDMFLHYGASEGVPGGIFNITEDVSNTLWVNTQGASWFALSGDSLFLDIRVFLKTDNTVKPTRTFHDSKGNIWVGSRSSGLFVYDGHEIILLGEKNGLKKKNGEYPFTVPAGEDKNGNVWFISGGDERMGCVNLKSTDRKVNFLPRPNEDLLDEFSAFLADKKGRIWFNYGRKGLGMIENGKVRWITEKDGVSDNTSGRFFEDSKDRIWFITWAGTLNVFDNGKFRFYSSKDGFIDDEVFNMFEDSFGILWFTTSSEGVFRYDGKKFDCINIKDGLNDNTIWNILQDRQKNVWVGTNKGINKIMLDVGGKIKDIRSFGYNEGFTGIECNQNSSFEDSKGNLWFGTPYGVTKYVPAADFENTTAPVLNISSVKLFYKDTDWSLYNPKINTWSGIPDNMTLPHDQNHLTISFIGIDFRSPDKVRYQFILEGEEKKWSPVVEKNEVTYSNLNPGKYTFKVKSCNADGVWNKKPISFSFTITPPWWRTTWFYILVCISLIAGIYYFIKWREKKLQREKRVLEQKVTERTEELNEKTNKLEDAYKHITDSIHYAKKIQEAILPPHDIISGSLRDYFVIYLPKDVVSGDYYAFYKKNDELIVVTADCTGHGVPGAFMSMIGIEQLGKIIVENNITSPDQVLNSLHTGIRKALKQDVPGGESRDGMDLAFCKFNSKISVLEYSGANRPLWLLRGQEILETKPNKFPIGGLELDNRTPFTKHSIALQKEDKIYTFTDGFADQFGGEKGKKFMLKNLERLLLSTSHLSMRQQSEKLRESFAQWKGDHEQVDDVLVIGILV